MIVDLKQMDIGIMLALKEAQFAFDAGDVPVGAVVINNRKVIGRGYNQVEQLQDATAHAEIIAITEAANTLNNWRLDDCQLYVTKEPCPMCAGAIINARISFVGFGFYDEQAGCCGSLFQLLQEPRFNHQTAVRGGIMQDECLKIWNKFFLLQRSKK